MRKDVKESFHERKVVLRAVFITMSFIILLWLIKAVEWLSGIDLTGLGLYPRSLMGTIGIITGPLIHGGIFHLISNTFPLAILGIGLFYFYHKIAFEVLLWIYAATGFWVWLIGRDAYHIGASGVIYGLLSFIFIGGILRRDSRSLAISLAVFVLYGGLIYGILPGEENISWESHLMGLLSGALVAVFFRNKSIYTGDESIALPEPEPENSPGVGYFSGPDNSSEKEIDTRYEYKPAGKKPPENRL
jgi:membrane associated rhomboid family serine protease